MVKISLLFLMVLLSIPIYAQEVQLPKHLNIEFEETVKDNILSSLNAMLSDLDNGKPINSYLASKNKALTSEFLENLRNWSHIKADSLRFFYQKQLINLFPVEEGSYLLTLSYIGHTKDKPPVIRGIVKLFAVETGDGFLFSLPVSYYTRSWNSKQIGNVTYHYRDVLNMERAEKFNKKNTEIAQKFGLEPERFEFYLTTNYQEIMRLCGMDYDMDSNGQYRDGFGIVAKTIFSVMGNEDFSHDAFHYYSGKVNERANRNWITEEGLAYSWGNGYYTDAKGNMVDQARMVQELQNYLMANPETSLLDLFENRPKVFNDLAPELSVRSLISSLIGDEVEKKHGMTGVLQLINAGRQNQIEDYFVAVNELLNISRSNFNKKVGKLISEYEAK